MLGNIGGFLFYLFIFGSLGLATNSFAKSNPETNLRTLQLQSGDRLDIEVFREDEISGTYEIDPSGRFGFPMIGEVEAAGMAIDELRETLIRWLRKYLVNPQVSIVRNSESKIKSASSIAVLGHVKQSGNFDFVTGLTLMRALSQAGGFAPSANKRKVRIVRTLGDQKKSLTINAKDIVDGKKDDVELQPSDMIFVPESIF